MSDLCTIRAAELSLEDVLQLACNHVLAKRRQAIDKHGTLQVVELVLHHTCLVTFHPLVVLLHLLVEILHMDAGRTSHLLRNTWDGKTTLLRGSLLALVVIL